MKRKFQTTENTKNLKSVQTGISDREKRKMFKAFSDRDLRQEKNFKNQSLFRQDNCKFSKSFQTGKS